MKTDRAYLCDGYGCDKQCGSTLTAEEWKKYECHHTKDEKHARNKCRRSRIFKCHKTADGVIDSMFEVEKRKK